MSAPRERIVRFGERDSLAGILSLPRDVLPGATHVVIVNAGIVHRVGPNRLYVDIARKLAGDGFPVLRFDLSGLGDSDVSAGGSLLAESSVADVRSAIDFLVRSRQAESFVVCGLCSGANHSILTTFADRRVAGAILIDPSVPRTRRSGIIHHARRLRHRATWGRLVRLDHPILRRGFERLRSMAVAAAAQGHSEVRTGGEPAPEAAPQIRAMLAETIGRGAHLMMVFTGGVNQQYNYRDQLFDLLPGFDFRGQLRLEFMPRTDHAVSDQISRTALLRDLGEWMAAKFPVSARPATVQQGERV